MEDQDDDFKVSFQHSGAVKWQNTHRGVSSHFFTTQPGAGAGRCADMPFIAAGLF